MHLVDALGLDCFTREAEKWRVRSAVDGVLGEPRAITTQESQLSRSGALRRRNGSMEEPS